MDEDLRNKIIETIEAHKKAIAELETDGIETIIAAAETTTKVLKENGRLYICGNGGSAADAQQ